MCLYLCITSSFAKLPCNARTHIRSYRISLFPSSSSSETQSTFAFSGKASVGNERQCCRTKRRGRREGVKNLINASDPSAPGSSCCCAVLRYCSSVTFSGKIIWERGVSKSTPASSSFLADHSVLSLGEPP